MPEIIPREEQIHTRTGKWGPSWSGSLSNSWFTDGSLTTESGRTEWTAVSVRSRDDATPRLPGESLSAQHPELMVVALAVRHSLKEGKKTIYIFTDSRAVANSSLFGLKSGPKQISKLMERMSGPGATGKNFMNPVRTLIYA